MLARILALAVLATVVADLGKASCDPVPTLGDDPALFSPVPAHDDDPCAGFCVPDCFCCSSLIVARELVLTAESGPSENTLPVPPDSVSIGASPIPDHPPRLLS
jgi:hypothetical protein